MQRVKIWPQIWLRKIDTMLFRLWFFHCNTRVLRHLLYLHRHGRKITTVNLPDYYLDHWLILGQNLSDYTNDLLHGCAYDIVPYAVATFAYSRFSGINKIASYRRHSWPFKPCSFRIEMLYPNDWNALYLDEIQRVLHTIQTARRDGAILPEVWLFRCFK